MRGVFDEDEVHRTSSRGSLNFAGTSVTYKIPDRDFYRKNFNTFGSIYNHFQAKLYERRYEDRRLSQPHYTSLLKLRTPYASVESNSSDGICCHFLRRGFTKPNKIQFNSAVWSADARWLVLGTQTGDLALWEGEALKVHKVISLPAHKEFYGGDGAGGGDRVKEQIPITCMSWKHHGNLLVTGDQRGLIQYCDETFRNVTVTREAHGAAVRGLSFSPLDAKLVSCSDDGRLHIWAGGRDVPEQVLLGHASDVKCIDWHPHRALIASGSRDSTLKLWDPKAGSCVCTINGHKKQVNCCMWNSNGNWIASGSTDGMIKLFDIRTMREVEVWKGQNSEVCSIAWHPIHETLLLSGGYNGSLIYWIAGQNQQPHSAIADAHRQSVDVIAWHPSGHMVGTASHDCILKFWSREPPGSQLQLAASEVSQEFPPIYAHGPIMQEQPLCIPPKFSGAPHPAGASSGSSSAMYATANGGGNSSGFNQSARGARASSGHGTYGDATTNIRRYVPPRTSSTYSSQGQRTMTHLPNDGSAPSQLLPPHYSGRKRFRDQS